MADLGQSRRLNCWLRLRRHRPLWTGYDGLNLIAHCRDCGRDLTFVDRTRVVDASTVTDWWGNRV